MQKEGEYVLEIYNYINGNFHGRYLGPGGCNRIFTAS